MGIEFIVIFVMFLTYIILTEIRVWFKEKNFDLERKSLLKSLLDEADVRKAKEMQSEELDKYYDLEREKAIYSKKPNLPEKVIYDDEEFKGPLTGSFETINQEIKDYEEKQKQ